MGTSTSKEQPVSTFICHLCGAACPSQDALTKHLNGKKHAAKPESTPTDNVVISEKEQRKLELQSKAFEQHEIFWVCHRDTLATLKGLVKFEEARHRNLLVQLPPGKKALFLSHRWLRDCHPDNERKQKYEAIVALLNDGWLLDAGVEFFWLDYMCISQDDLESQTKAVNSLPFFIKSCQYFITLYGNEEIGDRALMEVYDGRGWCRLERFVALATMSVQKCNFNMETRDLEQTAMQLFERSKLNPICGVFRDGGFQGVMEKIRIAPMLTHLCNFASQYGGLAAIRPLAKEIQESIVHFQQSRSVEHFVAQQLVSSKNATSLDWSQKNLEGSIPPELGQLTGLTKLSLRFNKLTGSIPPELGQLTGLTELWLNGNKLTGSIPPELGQLTGLTGLSLGANKLTASIPPELGQLTGLTWLHLGANKLTASIPPELGQLTGLTRLILSSNELTGNIPPELGQLTGLTELSLSSNKLTGSIPPELGQLTGLTWLNLRDNKLTGVLPNGLRGVRGLDISGNAGLKKS